MIRWGILGVGVAGRARARAIADDPRASLGSGFRGRPEEVGLRPAGSVGAVLADADAVAVCAPDEEHPALVEAALRAGCHVVCEFPLAPSVAEAERLLALARDAGRVLHVEHIELLGGAACWLRDRKPAVLEGSLSFTSRRVGAPVALGNLARLHRVVDVLGLPDALRVSARAPGRLCGALRFGEAVVSLDFHLAEGLSRRTRLVLQTPEGRLEQDNRTVTLDGAPVTLPEVGGLFLADQLHATARILDGAPPYLPDARLLAVLALVEALEQAPLGVWVAAP